MIGEGLTIFEMCFHAEPPERRLKVERKIYLVVSTKKGPDAKKTKTPPLCLRNGVLIFNPWRPRLGVILWPYSRFGPGISRKTLSEPPMGE